MELIVNQEKMIDLMKSFYQVTSMRFVLFNNDYEEILAYPLEGHPICRHMQKDEVFLKRCEACNHTHFMQCSKTMKTDIYYCHFGLVEVTVPLLLHNKIVGYAMLGQITDKDNYQDLLQNALEHIQNYEGSASINEDYLKQVQYFPHEKLIAITKILEACTNYIVANELLDVKKESMLDRVLTYIDQNYLTINTIEDICDALKISRTSLYALFQKSFHTGIQKYIASLRLEYAKKLLEETDLPIYEIAYQSRFNDYNYFSHVFKKTFHHAPSFYRSRKS